MSHHLDAVALQGDELTRYALVGDTEYTSAGFLHPLSRINLFVGPNNSGKSWFLRALPCIPKFTYHPRLDLTHLQPLADRMLEFLKTSANHFGYSSINDWHDRTALLPPVARAEEGAGYVFPLLKLVMEINTANQITVHYPDKSANGSYNTIRDPIQVVARQIMEQLKANLPPPVSFRRVYIPTLRSLRVLDSGDSFAKRTREDYFSSAKSVDVFTGQTLYSTIHDLLVGSLAEREQVAAFQSFLSKTFFGERQVVLIPKKDGKLYVKIGAERERPIHALGDGIQSIIIMTFPVFINPDQTTLVFVEEPELYLHPGFQRIFLEVLLRPEFDNAQYFFATHSNHMLDLTIDVSNISIFTFHKQLNTTDSREADARFAIENVSNDDRRTLKMLGTLNSSVFLANCTIWVERVTDRRYFLHILKLLNDGRSFKLDLHFSFVEYGGSNVTHWSFLDDEETLINVDRLCGRLFLITDRDAESGAKADRIERLRQRLPGRYHCLQCRELENLIPPHILCAVVQEYEKEPINPTPPEYDSYKHTPLGHFIAGTLLEGKQSRVGRYQEQSGTITGKEKFMDRIIEATKSINDLSDEAITIGRSLLQFIADNNSTSMTS